MENNKTTMVVVGLIALAVLVGGGLWLVNRDSDKDQMSEQSASQQKNQQDIVTIATNTEALSTLVTAVGAADLVSTLQGEGPFTVLAPTNDAFAALPAGTLDTLLKPENKDQLAGILTYHVISGNVMSSDLSNGQVVDTVQGGKLTVQIEGGKVYFVDAKGGRAAVAQADIKASNGVVHVIDAVLLPQ